MLQNDDTNRACGIANMQGACQASGISNPGIMSELFCHDGVLAPNQYVLIVGGYASSSGQFGLTIETSPGPPAPPSPPAPPPLAGAPRRLPADRHNHL